MNLEDRVNNSERNVYIGRRGVVFIDGKRFPPQDSPYCNLFKLEGENVIEKYEKFIIKLFVDDESF